jgi:hypothetical protein
LGIPPSSASEAVNELLGEMGLEGGVGTENLRDDIAEPQLCWQKLSGGPLRKFGRRTQTIQEMEFPKQAFAMIPISDVFDRVTTKLSECSHKRAH